MAMINIMRGKKRLRVSRAAYETVYRKAGYKEEQISRESMDFDVFGESGNVDGGNVDIETIPVSDMNTAQLKEYASKHGIDLKGTKSLSEARRVVQKHLREEKK